MLASARRLGARNPAQPASGPAGLTGVLGIAREHNGIDLTDSVSLIRLYAGEQVAEKASAAVGGCFDRDGPAVAVLGRRFGSLSAYRRGGHGRIRARV
ncbi:hypothetical protein E1202_15635 [Saccharopolyspora karakumensis]|uniref:Uncharacterized protein n=1 Tax=Saccharopolyspora karakumensis TaxID=2530386 RepID=A0A4R5BLS4_9PSEU|nr:hypothetical protein [Saccharopolyspora karakumensis]TDD87728.1 hypothetical protein E1202_15635 [Saccharopolyspora karakumensis]